MLRVSSSASPNGYGRTAAYDLTETLPVAFAGANKVLLVSLPVGAVAKRIQSTRPSSTPRWRPV